MLSRRVELVLDAYYAPMLTEKAFCVLGFFNRLHRATKGIYSKRVIFNRYHRVQIKIKQ